MEGQQVSRRFLRVRIGIALAILLMAACVSFAVTHYGRVNADQRDVALQELDTALVAVGQLSLAFDKFVRDGGVVNRSTMRSSLRRHAQDLADAREILMAIRANNAFAAASARILDQPALSPLLLLAEAQMLAEQIAAGDKNVGMERRLGAIGGQVVSRVLPVLMRVKETERAARAAAAMQAERLSWFVLILSLAALVATVWFVHLPMERAILAAQARAAEGQRAAEAASEAKTQFLATMSHEIRTPMNGVLGMTALLRTSKLPPKEQEMLDVIASSGQALIEIIDDILDLSKIEAGKVEIAHEAFDIAQTCNDVVRLFSGRAHGKGLSLTLDIADADANWWRLGDAKAVRQITSNLISNAIKFTDMGQVSLKLAYRAARAPQAEMIEIIVSDQGIGIPDHAQARIFESFEQADATTTREYGGTGLGLSIVLRLVEAMGGNVALKSQVGQGSTFTIMLPLEAVSTPVHTGPPPSTTEKTPVRHVLVADDNEVNRLVATKLLEQEGCTVSLSRNGHEAVEMTRTLRPDLVLMDGEMPVMGGLEATRAIRAEERSSGRARTRIIALSASVHQQSHSDALKAGMDGYLAKPLKIDELAKILAADLRSDQIDAPKDDERITK